MLKRAHSGQSRIKMNRPRFSSSAQSPRYAESLGRHFFTADSAFRRPALLVLPIIAIMLWSNSLIAQTSTNSSLSAEDFITTCLSRGEEACFPRQSDNVVPARLVQRLLQQVNRYSLASGFCLSNANIEGPLTLEEADIPCAVAFKHCVFSGEVNFSHCDFRKSLTFDYSTFGRSVSLAGSTVGHDLRLHEVVFEGGANMFESVMVSRSLDAGGARFTAPDGANSFNGMSVLGTAFFKKVRFVGSLDFIGVHVNGQLNFADAEFGEPGTNGQPRDFLMGNMNVEGKTLFSRTTFYSPVTFMHSHLHGLFRADHLTNLFILPGNVKAPELPYPTDFTGLISESGIDLSASRFADKISFIGCDVKAMDLEDTVWPTNQGSISVSGLRFKRITWGRDFPSVSKLKPLLSVSAYSPDFYLQVEQVFHDEGKLDDADRMFHARFQQDRKLLVQEHHWLRWLGRWILFVTVGDGRHPELTFVWSFIFVLFGYVVFRERKGHSRIMEQQDPDQAPRIYNAFWYSLDLFAPAIDLQAANFWKPTTDSGFPRHYMRIHRILGWIVIPIGIASLTGIIK